MPDHTRRRFLQASTCAAVGVLTDVSFLRLLSHAAATDATLDSDLIRFGPEMDSLVRLIWATPREQCVPVFVAKLKAGLSYQQFLAALFLAATQTGDMHQMAQVYAAHRVSKEARIEERLLPLIWILDRIKQTHDYGDSTLYLRELDGNLPGSGSADRAFEQAMLNGDKAQAELALLALARDRGPKQAMFGLWQFASRDLGGTLGHTGIGVANAWRTLDAIGWQHADPALRYLARELSRPQGDTTYSRNKVRVQETAHRLPTDWAGQQTDREVTLQLYTLLRAGKSSEACDFICSALLSGKIQAAAIWDGICLAAADVIFRYRTGGDAIGSGLVHIVTSTNALRFGFGLVEDPETRLMLLLQAAGFSSDWFVRRAEKEDQLRELNLLDDLSSIQGTDPATLTDVFEMLPQKADGYNQRTGDERAASDLACRKVFSILSEPGNEGAFLQTARSLLCVKASEDAHDFKYLSAAFEEANQASPEWRPFILASTVHALHGTQSKDATTLVRARDALG